MRLLYDLQAGICAGQVPAFPELFAQIGAAIAALGGRVLPKLNWSAPLDAAWLTTTGSIACTNADEVGLRMLDDTAMGCCGKVLCKLVCWQDCRALSVVLHGHVQ